MSYRLDQYLTLAGEGSRSQVKQFLKKGLVQVDGITEKQAKRKVLGNEQITLNGKPVYYEEHCYLMLHKPAGVVTATEDKKEKNRPGSNYFAAEKDLFPVGRLDKDTEGLLLVTNDGELAHVCFPRKNMWINAYFTRVTGRSMKKISTDSRKGWTSEMKRRLFRRTLRSSRRERFPKRKSRSAKDVTTRSNGCLRRSAAK